MKSKMLALSSIVTALAVAAPALAYVYCPWPYRLYVATQYVYDIFGRVYAYSYYVCL